jgi:RING finger/CHY zinc finger protein 1
MKIEFENIDYEIKNTPLGFTEDISILCNDCEKKSITKHHYYGTKCPKCKSYNTTKL